jgi:hypothetical protein
MRQGSDGGIDTAIVIDIHKLANVDIFLHRLEKESLSSSVWVREKDEREGGEGERGTVTETERRIDRNKHRERNI